MRTVLFGLVVSLCAMSVPSYGDVRMVAKNLHAEGANAVDQSKYDKQIDRLDQMSDEITAAIYSRKSGIKTEGPSQDGLKITLVKVSR